MNDSFQRIKPERKLVVKTGIRWVLLFVILFNPSRSALGEGFSGSFSGSFTSGFTDETPADSPAQSDSASPTTKDPDASDFENALEGRELETPPAPAPETAPTPAENNLTNIPDENRSEIQDELPPPDSAPLPTVEGELLDPEPSSELATDTPPALPPEPIGIIARPFKISVVQSSASNRVYQFHLNDGKMPRKDKIILARTPDGETNAMAFRVLRTYDTMDFVATKVREYPGFDTLELNGDYLAIEKIGDKFPEPSPLDAEKDNKDLEELETGMDPEAKPLDDKEAPEVDADDDFSETAQSLPQVLDHDAELDGEDQTAQMVDTDEDPNDLVIEEIGTLDPDKQWLSVQAAYLRNQTFSDNPTVDTRSAYFSGFGLRYAHNVGSKVFYNTKTVQDSFSLEGGFFLYKVIGYENTSDSFTLSPFVATLRYNLMFGENTTLFFYTGALVNLVMSSQGATTEAIDQLNNPAPAFGAGMLFRIGPRWNMRVDLGFDLIGAGLVLRF